jgi:hypothetical protein
VRRENIVALEYDLAAFDRPDRYNQDAGTPRTLQQALKVGENIIELFKAEGIADRYLQKA